MRVTDMTAEVVNDDLGRPIATVMITINDGQEVRLVVHESLRYRDTLNVEIDGEFEMGNPALRIHLNDDRIYDSMQRWSDR